MEVFECIKTRRSIRAYKDQMISQKDLEIILEAGRYAPSGANNQTTHFIVIQNKEVLNHLKDLVKEAFANMEVKDNMYVSMIKAIKASKNGNYTFYYNAPVLIITANKKDYSNALADCACALENMMIMANECNLGSCWINQLKWLNENDKIVEYLKTLGLKEDEKVWGSLSLGYPKNSDEFSNRQPLERKGNEVTYVK